MKASPHQEKVLVRLRNGEHLYAPRTYASNGVCIGLGVYRFSDKTPVTLETVRSMRVKGLVITRDVRDRDRHGYTGFSEVIAK